MTYAATSIRRKTCKVYFSLLF